MEEAPENGKESSNSAHANGMNEFTENICDLFLIISLQMYSCGFN